MGNNKDKKLRDRLFGDLYADELEVNPDYGALGHQLNRINALEFRNDNLIVDCETCKCLIKKENAFRGKSIIKKKRGLYIIIDHEEPPSEEYVHERYYCHRCKPKRKKK